MRKSNKNFICHKCKEVNPMVILIEKWSNGNNAPYRIEIMFLTETKASDCYMVKSITLSKKASTIISQIITCGQCQGQVKEVIEDNYLRIIKRNQRLERK